MEDNGNNILKPEENTNGQEPLSNDDKSEKENSAQKPETPKYQIAYAIPPAPGVKAFSASGEDNSPPPLTTDKLSPFIFETPISLHIKGLRKRTAVISGAFTAVLVFMYVWSFIFLGFARSFGMSDKSVLKLFGDFYFLNVVQVILSTLLFAVPFIIAAKSQRLKVSDIVPLGKPVKGTAFPYFGIGLAICAVSNVMTNDLDTLFGIIFEKSDISYRLSSSPTERGLTAFVLSLIASAVVPALVEEFGCRGIALGMLRGWGDETAIIVSSVLFGLVHANFVQIPFAFLAGVGFAVVRLKTGTLWVACAVHFCNNFISVLMSGPLSGVSLYIQNIVYVMFLSVSIMLGIIGVILLKKRGITDRSLNGNMFGFGTLFLVKSSLGAPMCIVFTVLCLLSSLTYIVI